MTATIVRDGNEPEIRRAVAWLESLGIPRNTIKGLNIYANVGEPLMIQPTLIVPEPEAPVTVDFIPDPSPVQRDLCPCGAQFEHAGQGDQEQHADWIDRRPEDARDRVPGY